MVAVADNVDAKAQNDAKDNAKSSEEAAALPPEVAELARQLKERLGLDAQPRPDGWLDVTVPAEQVQEIAFRLRDELSMNYLSCLSAVDWKDKGFEVVYHMLELGTRRRIVLRARLGREDPSLPTVVPVWPTANWHEREAWDLMGIRFEGHPDLRRILMREDWVGHPLRKDYVDQRPQRERQVHPS